MKGFLVLLLFGSIVFAFYYVAVHDTKLIGPQIVKISETVQVATGVKEKVTEDIHCALHFLSPLPSSTVSKPITIEVIVDNTKEDCPLWTVFEAQAGTVSLYDKYDKLLTTTILTTTSDWMTESPVTYTATLSDYSYAGEARLVFTAENPSGEKAETSFMSLTIE